MSFQGITALLRDGGFYCEDCGRRHTVSLKRLYIERGAIARVTDELAAAGGKHPYIVADPNTYRAAGQKVCGLLDAAGVPYTLCMLSADRPVPCEKYVGEALMQMVAECDSILGVGGGVINDICKLLARNSRLPYIYIATAPSMDGFASSSSAMELHGLKISLLSCPAPVILADTDVLAAAPRDMILSGIGDMAAKYISLAEWKMAHYITEEYYCPTIAAMVRESLDKVMSNAEKAVNGDGAAVADVTEGLVLAGMAMDCAGVSRPASGAEHNISHIRDMRALAFGTRTDFHGTQCGLAVLPVLREYEKLRHAVPDEQKALAYTAAFRYENRAAELREYIGEGAEAMIKLEAKEQKYDLAKHKKRLANILARWDEICAVMDTLPKADDLAAQYKKIGFPTEPEDIGMTAEEIHRNLRLSGEIRDKYVLPRLLWDLGIEI